MLPPVSVTKEKPQPKSKSSIGGEKEVKEEIPKEEKKKPKRTSGLSLKSIHAKREHKARQLLQKKHLEKEAHEDFTEEQVQAAWDLYIKRLKKKGRKILPSILATDRPQLQGTKLTIKLPNESMKEGVEREKGTLLAFLKESLQNTDITLAIKVDAKLVKRKAFTPIEKYEKLKEENPLIEKLKDTFGLDI